MESPHLRSHWGVWNSFFQTWSVFWLDKAVCLEMEKIKLFRRRYYFVDNLQYVSSQKLAVFQILAVSLFSHGKHYEVCIHKLHWLLHRNWEGLSCLNLYFCYLDRKRYVQGVGNSDHCKYKKLFQSFYSLYQSKGAYLESENSKFRASKACFLKKPSGV